jgi:hypothetical protein
MIDFNVLSVYHQILALTEYYPKGTNFIVIVHPINRSKTGFENDYKNCKYISCSIIPLNIYYIFEEKQFGEIFKNKNDFWACKNCKNQLCIKDFKEVNHDKPKTKKNTGMCPS